MRKLFILRRYGRSDSSGQQRTEPDFEAHNDDSQSEFGMVSRTNQFRPVTLTSSRETKQTICKHVD